MFFMASCGSTSKETAQTPATQTQPAKSEETKSIQINISSDSGKLDTKSSDSGNKIEVKKDKIDISVKD